MVAFKESFGFPFLQPYYSQDKEIKTLSAKGRAKAHQVVNFSQMNIKSYMQN